MNTGTPLDLTPFGSVLTGIAVGYWLLALAGAGLALWLLPRWWLKLPVAALVVGGFVYPVATHVQTRRQQYEVAKERMDKAMALFQERCKTAGGKIHRTVENVEGVVWMKWRPTKTNLGDQFKLDDPYGRDCGGTDCIANLLRVTSGADLNKEEAARHRSGYRYVESIDPADQKRYRYVGVIELGWSQEAIERHKQQTGQDPPAFSYHFTTRRTPIEGYTARYGITWDDISTREDREHWIAGSSLKVIDLKTDEVIAERFGFMVDRGQGSEAGGRQPWSFAAQHACPEFPVIGPSDPRRTRDYSGAATRGFATKVLEPTTGDRP